MATGGYVLTLPDGSITNCVTVLNKVTGIDLKTTGQTTLFTVPSGLTLVITDVMMMITTVSVFATAAIIRIGKASAYNEWLPLTTLTGLNTVNQVVSLNSSAALAIRQTFAAGEVVKLDVQTGAGATTLTASAHVLGYLF